ncbi:MAG: CoA pyrophosphatase [Gemmatimonadota bacterium]|nr:CoA pyrophosphatase [Gemmatimonadota bacterium]
MPAVKSSSEGGGTALDAIASRLAGRAAVRLEVEEPARRAAVALILRDTQRGDLELLLIKRALYEGDPWSGHIALPGGRSEPGDASLEQTAIRETREEIGIDLATTGRMLGALDDLQPRTPVLPPIVITPFVASVVGHPALSLSSEVAEAFWVPVVLLQDPAVSREVWIRLSGGDRQVPSFQLSEHIVWGLTERILRQFLELVGRLAV